MFQVADVFIDWFIFGIYLNMQYFSIKIYIKLGKIREFIIVEVSQ